MKEIGKYPFLILILLSVGALTFIGVMERLPGVSGVRTSFFAASPSVSVEDVADMLYPVGGMKGLLKSEIPVVSVIHSVKEMASGLGSDAQMDIQAGMVSVGESDLVVIEKETSTVSETKISENVAQEEKHEFQLVDDSYFDDALFIGDSRTQGFGMYANLPNITVFAERGLQVYTLFDRKIVPFEEGKITVADALTKKTYKKVYLMFGLNEMGWGNDQLFGEAYLRIIRQIRATQPDAIIYMQSVMHVSKDKSEQDPLFNNQNIDARNVLLEGIARGEGIYYLNLNEVFTDEEGNLYEGCSGDGIHLRPEYIEVWKNYLKAHAIVY